MRRWVLGLLFLGLAVGTRARAEAWRTNRSLWEDAVSKSLCLARPHANLALVYTEDGAEFAAREEWRRVVELTLDHLCVLRPQ